jgi:radical SAM protein with 4Fe4S-binding SPASM domain
VCETGAGILGRSPQAMTFPEFQRIIDKISPHTNTLMFYFMGEPFLHKDAYRMIRYAKKKNIPFVTSCTNGDVVNPEKLIESEIDEISFQIGGITQQTHQTYRQGSRLDRVLDNLEKTVLARNQSGAKTQIVCGFILMKHNEHEAQAFQSMMAKIGVDRALIVDPCVRNIEQAQRMLPRDRTHWAYDPAALERGILKPRITPRNSCPWIYYSLTVQVNGDVVPCCRDPKGQYIMGNLLRQDLDEIWNGKKFQDFRKKLLTDQKHIDICRLCSGFGVSRVK